MTTPSPVPDDILRRAMDPPLIKGRGALRRHSVEWGPYAVLTMPEPWEAARNLVSHQPEHVIMVRSMEHAAVDKLAASVPDVPTLVGLGGGMAMDAAKYVAWARGLEPILVPSIASVDASVTNTVAVRERGRVRYVDFGVAQAVVADYALMGGAPPHLNRAGIGDLLSIHTARWDWRHAASQGEVGFNVAADEQAAVIVDELEQRAGAIRRVDDEALGWIMDAYVTENRLCLQVGHSRPEEGSEHFFAYLVEHQTGRAYVHGELVCLGVLLMSRLQNNEPGRVESILQESGVHYQPRALDLLRSDLRQALVGLRDYAREEELGYSVIDAHPLDLGAAERLLAGLDLAE